MNNCHTTMTLALTSADREKLGKMAEFYDVRMSELVRRLIRTAYKQLEKRGMMQ